MQPKIVIHYVPGSVSLPPRQVSGSISALFYIEERADVFGWYAQARRARYNAAFFMVENFYSSAPPSLYRSEEDDVYGGWQQDCPVPAASASSPIRSPVPEAMQHELDRLQSSFIDDWLFFSTDPEEEPEREQYRRLGLGRHAFNVRTRRLHQLDRQSSVWTFTTAGSNLDIAAFLQDYWRAPARLALLSPESIPSSWPAPYDKVAISSIKKGRN